MVDRRMTSVSKRSGCVQSFLREASVRQYLMRSASASRGGARSGSAEKRRGRVFPETWPGATAETVQSRSRETSLGDRHASRQIVTETEDEVEGALT